MAHEITFVGGIHGVGKSAFCRNVTHRLAIEHVTASSLIREAGRQASDDQKRVAQVTKNQDALVQALHHYKPRFGALLLDGHFCLLNIQAQIEDIPLATFVQIAPKAVILLEDHVERTHERLEARDQVAHDIQLLAALQLRERGQAQYVCNALSIPLLICEPSHELRKALSFIETNVSVLRGRR